MSPEEYPTRPLHGTPVDDDDATTASSDEADPSGWGPAQGGTPGPGHPEGADRTGGPESAEGTAGDEQRREWPGVRVRTVVLGVLFVLVALMSAGPVWLDLDLEGSAVAVVALAGVGLALLLGAVTSGRRPAA